jgi:hypothetical protein
MIDRDVDDCDTVAILLATQALRALRFYGEEIQLQSTAACAHVISVAEMVKFEVCWQTAGMQITPV